MSKEGSLDLKAGQIIDLAASIEKAISAISRK